MNATAIGARADVAVSRDSSTPPTASPAPDASIGSRAPRRARIRLDTTAPTAIMAAIGSPGRAPPPPAIPRTPCGQRGDNEGKRPTAAVGLVARGPPPADRAPRRAS